VTKVHELVKRLTSDGYHMLIFGDPDHDEIRGIIGHGDSRRMAVIQGTSDLPRTLPNPCALISQTTQSLDAFEAVAGVLRSRVPEIAIHNTICKPTRQRQEAAIELARLCEFVYVVGSVTSANSKRLAEITGRISGRSMLIQHHSEVSAEQIGSSKVVGLTAGASTPDMLTAAVIRRVCEMFDVELVTAHSGFAGIAREVRKR
jgi:4-hydroxy-3-methylbut-2-enyl diphosphate reductase